MLAMLGIIDIQQESTILWTYKMDHEGNAWNDTGQSYKYLRHKEGWIYSKLSRPDTVSVSEEVATGLCVDKCMQFCETV